MTAVLSGFGVFMLAILFATIRLIHENLYRNQGRDMESSGSLHPPKWESVADNGSGITHAFNVSIGNNPAGFFRLTVGDP